MATEPSPTRPRRRIAIDTSPLKIPAYRRLFIGTVVTGVGSQMTAVAVPKQIFDITGSSTWVGLSALAALVPLIVFALWGGAVADAMDKRKLMILTNTGVAVSSAGLWIQAALGWDNIALIFVLLALQQAMFGMNQPARSAAIPRLVPSDKLPAANALNATTQNFTMIIGPLLAGALIPVLGLPTLYLLDTLALFAALWSVSGLPALLPGAHVIRRAGLREVFAGFRYLVAYPIILVGFLADIIAMVFGMPRALFPEMAVRTFGDPPEGGLALGLLYAAIPIGSVIGGLFSGLFTHMRRHGAGVVVSVVVWGLAIAGFGLSGNIYVAVFFLAVAGAADLVSMVFRGTMLLDAATDEMRGRIQGVHLVVVAGGPRIADLLHGVGGAALGTAAAVTAGGVAVVGLTVLMVCLLPAFWRYRAPVAEPA